MISDWAVSGTIQYISKEKKVCKKEIAVMVCADSKYNAVKRAMIKIGRSHGKFVWIGEPRAVKQPKFDIIEAMEETE